jgi:ankyrin repeat protein
LIKHGANVNFSNVGYNSDTSNHTSPLHMAAEASADLLISALLKNNADKEQLINAKKPIDLTNNPVTHLLLA